jgi:DNA/RNA endonuclease G (NUC1)
MDIQNSNNSYLNQIDIDLKMMVKIEYYKNDGIDKGHIVHNVATVAGGGNRV